ncbi:MAG: hypothetical protein J5I90_03200 [Caldilineales bacterium]|nr:hypothetical protein [Caldilineales bacterium]
MNDFDSILTRISLQLDGQLSTTERQRLNDDIDTHPQAAHMVDAFKQVDAMLRHAHHAVPLHDLSAMVMARIDAEQRSPRGLIGFVLLIAGTLSIWPTLLVAGAVFLVVSALLRPETWATISELLVNGLNAIYAAILALGTVQGMIGFWVLPVMAAALGIAILTLTMGWAKRMDFGHQVTRT